MSPEELLSDFLLQSEKNLKISKRKKQKNNFMLDKEENMVYTALDLYAKNMEDIVENINIPIQEISHILLSLELKGLIKEVGKNHYVRCETAPD